MNNDSPQKAVLVVLAVALVCSVMVSVASISLRPYQLAHQLNERAQHIVSLAGRMPGEPETLSDKALMDIFLQLDARVVNIDSGRFEDNINPITFDQRKAASNPERSVAIPADADIAKLGSRSRFATVYLVWDGEQLQRVIFPMHGRGMWSMLYGYLALEGDLNTIAAVTFYEQGETPGLGSQIQLPNWQAKWVGRKLRDGNGELQFRIASGSVAADSPAARHQVDALSGATVTANGVTSLVAYWFDSHGFRPFIQYLHDSPPVPPGDGE